METVRPAEQTTQSTAMEDNYDSDLFITTTSYDDYYYDIEKPSNPYPRYEIRLSIFLITALCVGVPCLIWAFYFVHRQRKTRGRISAFIILLLLCDLLQLLMYPYIVTIFLSFISFFDVITFLGLYCLKVCGLYLQQLVALEGVLTLKYLLISARIFSAPCYIIISIIILIIPLMYGLLMVFIGYGYDLYITIGIILAPVCLLVATGIITFKAPPTPASTPVTENRPGAVLFLVSTVNLVVLYIPCVLIYFIRLFDMSWFTMSFCLLSLTVISEPLLCVLVCRENLNTQTNQPHIELNSAQASV
ncbi:uncharacterized protein [Pseudorasbora parva]|uniref:uncharacterized protein n=1 Tax=Pseudorasbora parva TaxID=51549 RepID=UPI00351DC21E